MSEELKRCPFCGSEIEFIPSHVEEQNFVNSASIICRKCRKEYVGATFIVPGEIESEELTNNILINWWNTRPIEDEKDKEIARLKGNWDYFKEYLVALRNSRLHEESLAGSVLNRYAISLLNGLIKKMNAADNNVGSMEEEK